MLWIRNILGVGNFLVVRLSRVRLAEIRHSFSLGSCNHNILITMDFLLATVVQSLFFGLFWPLAASFRTINDGIGCIAPIFLFGLEFLRVSFWQKSQVVQGLFQDRQQAVDPLIGLRLAHSKQLTPDRLQRISLLIDQCKEQFLAYTIERPFATCACLPSSSFACHGL